MSTDVEVFQFPATGLPGKTESGGYLYIVEFDGDRIKVGTSTDPGERIAAHVRAAAQFGQIPTRGWISALHSDCYTTERQLVDLATSLGGVAQGREWFTNVDFMALVKAAAVMPLPEVAIEKAQGDMLLEFGKAMLQPGLDRIKQLAEADDKRRQVAADWIAGGGVSERFVAHALRSLAAAFDAKLANAYALGAIQIDLTVASRGNREAFTKEDLRGLLAGMDDTPTHHLPALDGASLRIFVGSIAGIEVSVVTNAADTDWATDFCMSASGGVSARLPEPPQRTVVAWFDDNDDLYAVYHRNDDYLDHSDDADSWHNADQHSNPDQVPLTWPQLLDVMDGVRSPLARDGLRGPVPLVPACDLSQVVAP